MNYTDRDFNPAREFWNAMTKPHGCPKCGYQLNGTLHVWHLLDGPVNAECNKCCGEWSVAIPIGDCTERRNIEALLEAEKRFYRLRNELADTIDMLHGRK